MVVGKSELPENSGGTYLRVRFSDGKTRAYLISEVEVISDQIRS